MIQSCTFTFTYETAPSVLSHKSCNGVSMSEHCKGKKTPPSQCSVLEDDEQKLAGIAVLHLQVQSTDTQGAKFTFLSIGPMLKFSQPLNRLPLLFGW